MAQRIAREEITMSKEIIVKMNTDYAKIKGCTYQRDLVRCGRCRWYVPANNSDHGSCGGIGGRTVYTDSFCDEGEEA